MAGFTLAQLEALESAIATGTLSVYYGNKRVEYRSMPELIAARGLIRADLVARGLLAADAVGGAGRGAHTLAEHSRD